MHTHTHRAHVPSRLLVVCVNDVQEQRQQTTVSSWRSCILYLVTTSPSVAPDGTNTAVSRGCDPRRPTHTHTQVRDVRAHDDAAASRVRSRDGDEKKDLVVVGCNRAAAVPR